MDLEKKILELYRNQYFQKVKVKKVITMLKLIIVDKEKDLEKVLSKANITKLTLDKYILDKELMSQFLTEREYLKFLGYYYELNKEYKNKYINKKREIIINVIDEILNSRYNLIEISQKNYITDDVLQYILSEEEFLKQKFGYNIIEIISNRIQETSNIRKAVPNDKYLVEDKESMRILKEGIYYLDPIEYKVIKVISSYLSSNGNIDFLKQNLEIDYSNVIYYLQDKRLNYLLKEDVYQKIKNIYTIEKVLFENDYASKEEVIRQVINDLKKNKFDLNQTIVNLGLPYYLVKRILEQRITYNMCDDDTINKIEMLFNKEKKENKKL